jgi:hypothetical protein
MDSIKSPMFLVVGLVLLGCGAALLGKGGLALAGTKNKDQNDDLNMKGWKGLGSNWAGAAVLLMAGGGSSGYGAFGNFGKFGTWASNVWNYVFG